MDIDIEKGANLATLAEQTGKYRLLDKQGNFKLQVYTITAKQHNAMGGIPLFRIAKFNPAYRRLSKTRFSYVGFQWSDPLRLFMGAHITGGPTKLLEVYEKYLKEKEFSDYLWGQWFKENQEEIRKDKSFTN